MSDAASEREWRFYLDDMIGFADAVLAYTEGLDQDAFVGSLHRLKSLIDAGASR